MLSSSNKLNIKQFFANSYHIPAYQRDYAWEKPEISDLLEDFSSLRAREMPYLFLGQVVICASDNKRYIVDGQQRITTIWLFFLAIRNLGVKLNQEYSGDEYSTSDIEGCLGIARKDRRKDNLTLSEKDSQFFSDLSYEKHSDIRLSLPRNARKARKNLINNYWTIFNQLQEWIDEYDSYNDKVSKLNDIQDDLFEEVYVFSLETDEEAEAYTIFETLNARGRDLATADLLKNNMFKTAGQANIEEVKKNWNSMIEALGTVDPTKYIRSLWNSRHESTCREKLLYRELKRECNTPRECLEFSSDLSRLASVYRFLADPENAATPTIKQTCFGEKTKRQYRALSTLRVKTYFPILLAAFDSDKFNMCSQADLSIILSALEKVIIRNLVIGDANPNSLETSFAKIAYAIYSQSIVSPESVANEILELAIRDDLFELKLQEFIPSESSKYKARFILRSLVNHDNNELELIEDNNAIHIEHIMPISNEKWQVEQSVHDEYLWHLGNLTLLGDEYNEDATNDTFEIKKLTYQKSEIKMTKALCEYETWGQEEIQKREDRLRNDILELWSI